MKKCFPLLKRMMPVQTTMLGMVMLFIKSVYKELHADHETGAADNK